MVSVKRKTYVKYVGLLIDNNRELKHATFLSHGRHPEVACQDNGLPQIFQLIVSTSQKRLDNINEVEWRQAEEEKSTFPVGVHGS